jgi:hypothetical protein
MHWYGSEIRMYTLFTFLTIANHFFFLRMFRERAGWFGYTLTALLRCFYTLLLLPPFVLPSDLLALATHNLPPRIIYPLLDQHGCRSGCLRTVGSLCALAW